MVVAHTFNFSTREAEAGRQISVSSRPAWSTRASSRTGFKATEKPFLNKKKCTYCFVFLFFVLFVLFSEIGFLCVTVLAVLELALVDQAGLKLTEIHLPLPLPPECWD